MNWPAAAARLNQTMTRTFGTDVIIRVGTTETILRGVFRHPFGDAAIGGMDFRESGPFIEFITTEFIGTGAKARDTVIVNGIEYTITAEPEPDDGGMTKCVLRRYG